MLSTQGGEVLLQRQLGIMYLLLCLLLPLLEARLTRGLAELLVALGPPRRSALGIRCQIHLGPLPAHAAVGPLPCAHIAGARIHSSCPDVPSSNDLPPPPPDPPRPLPRGLLPAPCLGALPPATPAAAELSWAAPSAAAATSIVPATPMMSPALGGSPPRSPHVRLISLAAGRLFLPTSLLRCLRGGGLASSWLGSLGPVPPCCSCCCCCCC